MKLRSILVNLIIVLAILIVICAGCSTSAQQPKPVPAPGITVPPPPTKPTPPPESPPTPTPSPAPTLTPAPPPAPIYSDPAKAIRTKVDEGFAIGLHVVKRLGASWQVSYDANMLKPLIQDLYIDDNPKSPGLSGTQYFRFEALKTGSTQIECKLKHGTTGPISEQKTFKIEVE